MATSGSEAIRTPGGSCANCEHPLSRGQLFCSRCGQKAGTYTGAIHILCYAVLVIPGWLLLRQDPALATHLYYAYLPLWPLYFGFANSQFLDGPRWWSALRGVMALLLSQGATLLIVSLVTAAFERH